MSIHSFFSLLGGLALFLYGMQMMSTNLEAAAGSRMKQILEPVSYTHLRKIPAWTSSDAAGRMAQ